MKYIVMSLVIAVLGGVGIGMTDLSQEVGIALSFGFGMLCGHVALSLYHPND